MITSLDNNKVKDWTKLHNKKYRNEEYLLFDEDMIKEAHKKKYLTTLIYYKEKPFDFDNSYEVSKKVLDKISKNKNVNYIGIAKKIIEKKNYVSRVLLLDNIQDPLNLGRIIEECFAFGFDSLILSNDTCDLYNDNCISCARNSLFNVNIAHSSIEEEIINLKKQGFDIYATGLSNNTVSINNIEESNKMAFVLGNEGSGVKKNIMNLCDNTIKIDMNNMDSLNVAMAGAILLYKFNNVSK